MASWIASRLTEILITSSEIEECDRELYHYGFFLLVSRVFYLLVTIIAGLLMDILLESIIFYATFILLRTYAGGIHARTETACTILTTLALFASISAIRQLCLLGCNAVSLLMLISGSLCILLISPLDTDEKPLCDEDKKKYRKISISITLLCVVGALIAMLMSFIAATNAVACGVFLESILLFTGKVFSHSKDIHN